MAVYWLTFRLEENASYSHRLSALEEAIKSLATKWWLEPTSFYVFESASDMDAVARTVKGEIDPSVDLVLIGMPYVKSARLIGASHDGDIFELIDFAKKA